MQQIGRPRADRVDFKPHNAIDSLAVCIAF
jgi:hypothetical protein